MDRSLASDGVFGGPLLAESRALGFLANGAVPLFPVMTVIRMPGGTGDLARVLCRDTVPDERVISDGHNAKVVRVDASPIVASVVDHHPIRNVSDPTPVGYSMGASCFTPKPKGSVAVPIQRPLPVPASSGLGRSNPVHEPPVFRLSHSFHVEHGIPWPM